MYLRCAQCQATTWIATYEPVGQQDVVCQTCGREYRLAANDQLAGSSREQYEYAVRFAETHLIDLPSAYSVLLGIMSVEEAQEAKQRENEKEQAAKARPATVPRAPAPVEAAASMPEVSAEELYDPGFREAVEAGCLTVQQAIERGSREAYAMRLARRHALPRELAFRVADNRVTLQAANQEVQSRIARARAEKERKKPASKMQRAMIAVFALAVLAGVGTQSYKMWKRMVDESRAAETNTQIASTRTAIETVEPDEAPTDGPRVVRTHLRTDPMGRVTQIVGPDPRSVLIAYCESGLPDRSLQPVELIDAVPPELDARDGLFRNEEQPGELYAIRIRRDEQTRRWIAGDGARPIDARVAPERPAEEVSLPTP